MINLHRCTTRVAPKCRPGKRTSGTMAGSKSSGEHPTAGIIVVGDEILKGQVKDSNCFYACKLLHKHGVRVQKIATVRDDVQSIAKEVKHFSNAFNYVFTSGGIGPTHDDVTYEAVAAAFNDTMHYHPTLVDIIKTCFNCGEFPSPAYKMAYIPTRAILKFGINEATGQTLSYPCVTTGNVYIFPGSPVFFEMSFQALCKELFATYGSFATAEVYVDAKEESFATALGAVAREWPSVTFGSYPERNRYYKVRVTIESERKEDTEAARKMFCGRVPANVLVDYDRAPHVACLSKYEALMRKPERRSIYQRTFKKFLSCYEKAEEAWIYLDGSKESVLMIHFARIALEKSRQPWPGKLRAICFKSDTRSWSANANRFLSELAERYNVEFCKLEYEQADAVSAIKNFVALRPEFRTLLVGKRSNGNDAQIYNDLAAAADQPSLFVQVHFPLLDWTDKDVASFFRSLCLPYYTIEI